MFITFTGVFEKFEKEMFSREWSSDIAESTLDYALFKKDDDNVYALNFNREEKTYSITMVKFKPSDGDFEEEVYIETYPIKFYNREFLTSRIVLHIEKTIMSEKNN